MYARVGSILFQASNIVTKIIFKVLVLYLRSVVMHRTLLVFDEYTRYEEMARFCATSILVQT